MWPFKSFKPQTPKVSPTPPVEWVIHDGKRLLVKSRRVDYTFDEMEVMAEDGLIISGFHCHFGEFDYRYDYVFVKTDARVAREARDADS